MNNDDLVALARECGALIQNQTPKLFYVAFSRPTLADFAARLRASPAPEQGAPKLDEIEQYRMQMAGICTAAIGYWKEGDSLHPDYDTPALREVAKLYVKYDALYKAAQGAPDLTWIDDQNFRHTMAFGRAVADLKALYDRWPDGLEEVEAALNGWKEREAAQGASDTRSFKNFHRMLCERFGYCHDEKDWRRDQVSLIEHIAKQSAAQGAGDEWAIWAALEQSERDAYLTLKDRYPDDLAGLCCAGIAELSKVFGQRLAALSQPTGQPVPQVPPPMTAQTALQQYNEIMQEGDKLSAVERLRLYCSKAMTGQDWIDVEPFFDAVIAEAAQGAGDERCDCGVTCEDRRDGCRYVLADRAIAQPAGQPEPTAHVGMTIAGDGASMLGRLMREQRASRLGVYPDGNPNAGAAQAEQAQDVSDAEIDALASLHRLDTYDYESNPQAYWRRFARALLSHSPAPASQGVSDAALDQMLADQAEQMLGTSAGIGYVITVPMLRAIIGTISPAPASPPTAAQEEPLARLRRLMRSDEGADQQELEALQDLIAAPSPLKVPEPLSEPVIEDCIDAANRKFNGRHRGPSGQQLTTYDDWKHWLAKDIAAARDAAWLAANPAGEGK